LALAAGYTTSKVSVLLHKLAPSCLATIYFP
jgi:hypothetical protein